MLIAQDSKLKAKSKVVETEAPEALEHTPLAIILKYRNIDLLSIGYAFQPGLRTD